MNAFLKTNFLRNQKTILNSIQLGSIAKSSLPSIMPIVNQTVNLRGVDMGNHSQQSLINLTKPSHALSFFKDFSLMNAKSYFSYASKVTQEKDGDGESANVKEEEGEGTANNEDVKKGNDDSKETGSTVISKEEFNQIKGELESQMKKTDALTKKFEEMRRIYLDGLSEGELIKQRHQREIKKIKDYAIGNFAKDLVDVHDNFTRAFDIVKDYDKGKNKTNDGKFNSFIEGIHMVNNSLSKVFKKHGIIEYTPKTSDKFNPTIHEAIYEFDDSAKTPGSIGKVLCSGFKIGDRILRPAKVGVIKKK